MPRSLPAMLAVVGLATLAVAQDRPRPPDQPPADAQPLPPAPKADPKSEHTALQKDNSLVLEKKPDGSRRVLVQAEVCLREGPLEVFVCKKQTKEHEAILRVAMDARFIHAALEAAGAKAGTPVQFVNPTTREPEYKPAAGAKVKVTLHYTKDGKPHTHPAQEWVTDLKTMKPMAHDWVFAGSRFVKNPDKPNDPPYYTANLGEVVGISNFPDSMLDLPVQVGSDDATLAFKANTDRIPPLLSKVWVILEPEPAKK